MLAERQSMRGGAYGSASSAAVAAAAAAAALRSPMASPPTSLMTMMMSGAGAHAGLRSPAPRSPVPRSPQVSRRGSRASVAVAGVGLRKERISTSVRIRPLLASERAQQGEAAWVTEGGNCVVDADDPDGRRYFFEHVFGPTHSNEDVFARCCAPVVDSCLQGYNGTIFVYGQTSSGKTHTMAGDVAGGDMGIIPRAAAHIFAFIREHPDLEFLIRTSFLELYNEEVHDLLGGSGGGAARSLPVREADGEFYVEGLRYRVVRSEADVVKALQDGVASQHFGASNLSERSSRSHTVFQLVIEMSPRPGAGAQGDASDAVNGGAGAGAGAGADEAGGAYANELTAAFGVDPAIAAQTIKVAILNLVDLAGSETLDSESSSATQKETKHINLSLTMLKTVIRSLSNGEQHVPYRNSQLTKLLKPALGGNAHTAIVCTATPALAFKRVTRMTLLFAAEAGRITNRRVVNLETNNERALLAQYRRQIDQLSERLEQLSEADARMQEREAALAASAGAADGSGDARGAGGDAVQARGALGMPGDGTNDDALTAEVLAADAAARAAERQQLEAAVKRLSNMIVSARTVATRLQDAMQSNRQLQGQLAAEEEAKRRAENAAARRKALLDALSSENARLADQLEREREQRMSAQNEAADRLEQVQKALAMRHDHDQSLRQAITQYEDRIGSLEQTIDDLRLQSAQAAAMYATNISSLIKELAEALAKHQQETRQHLLLIRRQFTEQLTHMRLAASGTRHERSVDAEQRLLDAQVRFADEREHLLAKIVAMEKDTQRRLLAQSEQHRAELQGQAAVLAVRRAGVGLPVPPLVDASARGGVRSAAQLLGSAGSADDAQAAEALVSATEDSRHLRRLLRDTQAEYEEQLRVREGEVAELRAQVASLQETLADYRRQSRRHIMYDLAGSNAGSTGVLPAAAGGATAALLSPASAGASRGVSRGAFGSHRSLGATEGGDGAFGDADGEPDDAIAGDDDAGDEPVAARNATPTSTAAKLPLAAPELVAAGGFNALMGQILQRYTTKKARPGTLPPLTT